MTLPPPSFPRKREFRESRFFLQAQYPFGLLASETGTGPPIESFGGDDWSGSARLFAEGLSPPSFPGSGNPGSSRDLETFSHMLGILLWLSLLGAIQRLAFPYDRFVSAHRERAIEAGFFSNVPQVLNHVSALFL